MNSSAAGATLKSIGERGFTLVEILISMAILLVTVLSSFYVLIASRQMAEEARSRLSALNSIRSVMETIKDTSIDGLTAIDEEEFAPADLQEGQVEIATNPAVITAQDLLATVTVTVTWNGPRNRESSLEVSTMKSR